MTAIGDRTLSDLANENAELCKDLEKTQADLTTRNAELNEVGQSINDSWRQFCTAQKKFASVEARLKDMVVENNTQAQWLEEVHGDMATLQEMLRREREDYVAYRVQMQAAANAVPGVTVG